MSVGRPWVTGGESLSYLPSGDAIRGLGISMMNTVHIKKSSSTVLWIPFHLMSLFCNPEFPFLLYPMHFEELF